MRLLHIVGVAWAIGATAVFAQVPGKPGKSDSPFSAPKPLPELKGHVSWKTLAQVDLVKLKDRYAPQFSEGVTALNKREVKIQGYMMPLDPGERQSRFLLTAMPQSCNFCIPGGPAEFVEVRMAKPVKFTFEPIVVRGRMALLDNDPGGLFYRLTDAVVQ